MRLGQWAAFGVAVLVILGATTFLAYRIRQRSAALATPAPAASTPSASASTKPDALPPALRELVKGMQLPEASEAFDYRGQPNLVITRGGIYLEDQRLANLAEVPTEKLQRVDPVFTALKAQREEWKTKNPTGEFAGELALWVDLSVNVTIIKSVFQTAGFAGYPNGGFVARCRCPAGITVLPADARIPGPPREAQREPGATLTVLLRDDAQVELSWASHDAPAEPRTVPLDQLPPALAELWAQGQAWRGAGTPWQKARLYVDPTQPFRSMMRVLETLSVIKYETGPAGERQAFPAFQAEFRIDGPPPAGATETEAETARRIRFGATTVSGRLAPALIQAEVRRHFGDFRACYEATLAKNPNATGRVTVVFVIGRAGEVTKAAIGDASASALAELAKPDNGASSARPAPTLHDKQLERCMVTAFKKLKFPPPEDGIVNVAYPFVFAPAG